MRGFVPLQRLPDLRQGTAPSGHCPARARVPRRRGSPPPPAGDRREDREGARAQIGEKPADDERPHCRVAEAMQPRGEPRPNPRGEAPLCISRSILGTLEETGAGDDRRRHEEAEAGDCLAGVAHREPDGDGWTRPGRRRAGSANASGDADPQRLRHRYLLGKLSSLALPCGGPRAALPITDNGDR